MKRLASLLTLILASACLNSTEPTPSTWLHFTLDPASCPAGHWSMLYQMDGKTLGSDPTIGYNVPSGQHSIGASATYSNRQSTDSIVVTLTVTMDWPETTVTLPSGGDYFLLLKCPQQ